MTASISSLLIALTSPVLKATNELFLDEPVAKALGCGELNIPTSGIFNPSCDDCFFTTSRYHLSNSFEGFVINLTPAMDLAIHLDIYSEINEPPIPNTSENSISES